MQCYYCEIQTIARAQGDDRCRTKDHIIPMSRGGRSGGPNLITACEKCNQFKGDSLPEEFSDKIRARIAKGCTDAPYPTMLKNNEALITKTASYRADLFSRHTLKRKGFDPQWSTLDKDTVILKPE